MARAALVWVALAAAICVPIALAATSPQLAWRGPVYILAGFAGIVALGLMLVQPLLIAGYLPGLSAYRAACASLDRRRAGCRDRDPCRRPLDHQSARHDRRPSLRIADAILPLWRDRHVGDLRRRAAGYLPSAIETAPRTWRIAHMLLAIVIVAGSVVHAILIEGTMETVSKAALCALVLAAAIKVMADLWARIKRGSLRGEVIARQ